MAKDYKSLLLRIEELKSKIRELSDENKKLKKERDELCAKLHEMENK